MQIPIRQYWKLLVRYVKPQWPKALVLACLLAVSTGLRLYNPQIIRSFIDGAIGGSSLDSLTRIAIIFLSAAAAHPILNALAKYVGEDIGWTSTNQLRLELVAHCIDLDMAYHKERTPGELIERIDGDVNALSTFFARFLIDIVSNIALLVGVLLLLLREDWRMGLAVALFAAFALYVLIRIRNIAVEHWAKDRAASASFYGFLGEHLAGTEDLRANGAVPHVMNRFFSLLRSWLPIQQRAGFAAYTMWNSTVAVFALGDAASLGMGSYLWAKGLITVGTVYMVFHYTDLLRHPIEQIRTQLQDLQKASASIARVQELLAVQPTIVDGPGTPLPAHGLSVELDNVTFTYAQGEPVLRQLNVSLAPGKVLGLLGRTGSGKSTLARLLLRLYDVTHGEVRLGGVPIKEATLADLQRRVGVVTQEVQLFAGTVRDNLTFYNSAIADEQIDAVIAELGLSTWYQSLPNGLDTVIEGGSGLSAGEAQLLAFARLFLANPGLVILDEASSRLDPATEQLIERAVTRLLAGRTGVIIAHRLATVQRADEILILEDGQVLEHGERERLASDPTSRFRQLLETGLEEVLA